MRAIISLGNVRRLTGDLQIPVSTISALAAFGALVAFWAPAYLRILDTLGAAQFEALGWLLFAVGAIGLASIVYLAWQDMRDPVWRAAHGLPERSKSA
jgi:hypothetical protein